MTLPPAAGPRGTTHHPLMCCLCGSYFSSDDLHEHYSQCRREKVSAWQRFPPPYDVQGADVVLRPKVLFARNMLPPIPGKNASPATVSHFNRTSKELFLAQSVACDRCGQVFTPDQMSDFKAHTMSCDRSRASRDRSATSRNQGFVSIESAAGHVPKQEIRPLSVVNDSPIHRRPATAESHFMHEQEQHRRNQERILAELSGLSSKVQQGENRALSGLAEMARELTALQKAVAQKEDQLRAQATAALEAKKSDQREHAAYERKIEELTRSLQEKYDDNAELRKECLECKERLESERTAQALERREAAEKLQLAQAKAEAAETQACIMDQMRSNTMGDAIAAKEALENRVAAAEARIEALEMEMGAMDQIVADAITAKRRLKDEEGIHKQQAEDAVRVAVEETQRKEREASQSQLEELLVALEEAKASNQRSAQVLAEQEGRIGGLEGELSLAKERERAKESDDAEAEAAAAAAAAKETQAARVLVSELEARLSAEKEEHSSTVATLTAQQKDKIDVLRRRQEKELAAQEIEADRRVMEVQRSVEASASKEIAEKERGLAMARKKVEEAEKARADSQEETARAMAAAEAVTTKLREAEARRSAEEAARAQRWAKEDEKRRQREAKEAARRERDLERSLKDLERKVQAARASEQRLRDANEASQRALADRRGELQQVEARHATLRSGEQVAAQARRSARASVEAFSRAVASSACEKGSIDEVAAAVEQVLAVATDAAREPCRSRSSSSSKGGSCEASTGSTGAIPVFQPGDVTKALRRLFPSGQEAAGEGRAS